MQQKPYRWNVSPALIAPNARDLWRGVAFVAPLWGGTGKGALLNSRGQPLAGANLVAGSTLQWRGTPFGAGVGISGASNLLTQSNFAPIVTSNGVGTGDFTLVCLTDPKAEARASTLLGQRQAASPYNWGLLFLNSDISGNQVSGQLSFSTQDSTGANVSVNVPGVIDGTMHMFGGVRRSGQMRAYVDGGLRATATGAAQNIYTASHGFAIGNLPPDASVHRIATDTEVVFAAGWNRALSDAEMRLLARDAFCMFRPAPEWRGVWTPLVGGGAVLSPADFTNSFLFETPVISQTHNLSVSDAAFASGYDNPVISQNHSLTALDALMAENFEAPTLSNGAFLSPAKSVFAASIETAGILQAHLFSAQEINLAFAFESATLAMNAQSTPDYRTIGIANNLRRKNADGDARNAPVVATNRTRSITE